MNTPQFNSPQMEFGFAEAVTGKGGLIRRVRKSTSELMTEKPAQAPSTAEGVALESTVTAPAVATNKPARPIDWTNPPGVFGKEWIDEVCRNIRNARDLREGVALSACYLTDLIDQEIDVRGHNAAWKQEYEAYCWTHYFNLTVESEPDLEELRAMWWVAGIVLNAYNGANDRSDWELFEDLCAFEADFDDLDGGGAETSLIEFLSSLLWNLHERLFRSNGATFTELLQDSKS